MFAAPAWLWALLAVAVPLALHLWSRRPNTVVQVSSVRHLLDLPTARRWSRKLTEPLLLLLRLTVVALLALALARPRLAGFTSGHGGPLVLLDPRLLSDSQALASDPLLDSLRKAGDKVRLLTAGLPATPIAKPALWYKEEPAAIWDLVAQADRGLAPDNGLIVIGRPSPDRLGGVRPQLGAPVRWHIPASSSSAGWWIGDARRIGDEVRLWLYHGDAGRLGSRSVTTPARPGIVSPADLPAFEIDSGSTRIRLLGGRQGTAFSIQRSGDWTEIRPASVRRITIDSGLPEVQATRLQLAAMAAAAEIGDSLVFAATETDLRLPDGLSDSVILSPALADSVLARWPSLPGPSLDSRAVGLGQLELATAQTVGRSRTGDATRWLLVVTGLVLLLERWLAGRGGIRRTR